MVNSILWHKVSSQFGAFLHRAQLNKIARSSTRIVRAGASRVRVQNLLLLLLAPAAMAQTTTTFNFTGSTQIYTVPKGITSISVVAIGGAGGSFGNGSIINGAEVRGTLVVVPGEELTVNVGGAGSFGSTGGAASGGFNGGAIGHNSQGGGGGATDLRRASTNRTSDYSTRNAMLVAAGGGGGGTNSAGGAAGLLPDNGNGSGGKGSGNTVFASGGYGGTQTGPGAGGDITPATVGGPVALGAAGSGGNGGDGGALGLDTGGGGGGGGYYGGGGGSSNVVASAGGGGASSWVMATGSSAISSVISPTASVGKLSITSNPTPLPVVLARFVATAMGPDAVNLAWATASELNSASFAVERSTDGQAFTSLVTLTGAGTSSSPIAYDWVDALLPAFHKTLYYRLRHTDLDAAVTYSPVRTVTPAAARATAQLQAYPNPAHNMVSVKVSGVESGTPVKEYQIFNSQGRLVHTQATSAAGTELLPLTGLPAGMYLLRYGCLTQHLTVE